MTAYIKKIKGALWLVIDHDHPEQIVESLKKALDMDDVDDIGWPILEEEIPFIRDACEDYLERKSQEIMEKV